MIHPKISPKPKLSRHHLEPDSFSSLTEHSSFRSLQHVRKGMLHLCEKSCKTAAN